MLTVCLGIAFWMSSRGRNTVTINGGLLLFIMTIVLDTLLFMGILDAILDVYRGVPCG